MIETIGTRLRDGMLGTTHDRTPLSGRDQFALACECLTSQSRRRLTIFTFDLDPPLYDREPFAEALRRLALEGRESRIQILLQENLKVQQNGHRLLNLARRLPSRIEIRRPINDYIDFPENFLIADTVGYVHRSRFPDYQGVIDFNDPLRAIRLQELFDHIWERSEQDIELRQFSL
ncbi:MAG: acyltransferase [Candidatus Sedimenticola endophacoides]|nr:MAG: acyltransferase [Candidatus Sedimenticola endophacoides]